MDRVLYDNSLRKQCMSLPALCGVQIEGVQKGLDDAFTMEELLQYRRIILTGCGDSYAAARAAIPAFKKFAGRFGSEFRYVRAIDAARYLVFDPKQADATMVVAVSCSGSPARIEEVLRRAGQHGCMTLAVTNNPQSPAAAAAKKSLIVHTPAFPEANPGLRNYYASLTGLYMLAARLGEATGCSLPGTSEKLAAAIVENTKRWESALERIDGQMYRLAETWKDFETYDFIGDDISWASAFFMGAKIVEAAGKMTYTDDSEDWCHTGIRQREPQTVGTVIGADKEAHNRSRIGETAMRAAAVGRPVLLIANGGQEAFGIDAQINTCTVPDPPEGFAFLLAMMNYVPGALLAGYTGAMNGEPLFRGGGVWAAPGSNTIRSSEIEVL